MKLALTILELGKVRLSALAIFAVVAGLFLGSRGTLEMRLLVAATLGTFLVAAGGNALNMWLERELDKRMPRTADRPIPSGRLSPRAALVAGLVAVVSGLVILALETNALATGLCAAVAVIYVGVYTPLKRKTTLNTLVGAVPGALPPVVGYAAAGRGLDLGAVVLFAILFFWQIPHFLSISWHYRADYAAGGMKMLPVVEPEGGSTSRHMLLYTAGLVFVSLLPYGANMAGQVYLAAAICLDVLFLTVVLVAAVWRLETAMRQTFWVSIVYLPLLFGVMVADRTML